MAVVRNLAGVRTRGSDCMGNHATSLARRGLKPIEKLGSAIMGLVEEIGSMALLLWSALRAVRFR